MPDQAWRAPVGEVFHWRHYGDESVLFDARSGLTHFLTAIAVEALEAMRHQPMTYADLCAYLAEVAEPACTEEFSGQVQVMVRHLAGLNLIEHSASS